MNVIRNKKQTLYLLFVFNPLSEITRIVKTYLGKGS